VSQSPEISFVLFADFSWGADENNATIPWAEIVERPHHYFDTSLYQLPYSLNAPATLKSNPLHIFSLHQFFLSRSSTSLPFQFRSKQEIMKRTSSVVVSELDHNDNDDFPSTVLSSTLPAAATTLPTMYPTRPSASCAMTTTCGSPSDEFRSEFEAPQSITEPANLDPPIPSPSATSNPSILNPSSIMANSGPKTTVSKGTNATSASTREIMKGNGKKGKGHPKRQSAASTKVRGVPKSTKTLEGTQPTGSDTVNSPQIEPRSSTRKSGRAADLKRKQADREAAPLPEKSEPAKKKKRLQDRWFYEPVVAGQP
jgi:hypothetical protein